jgi:hypothetical protein
MAFIATLDYGETLKTMVLTRVDIKHIEVVYAEEEEQRRAEFRTVKAAVADMMEANNLSEIPAPMDFAGGVAANFMGDDPETEEVFEGFPDSTTPVTDKGYNGTDSPRDGYVLYEHDMVEPGDDTRFRTVKYITTLSTAYYYTCESSGLVRQFDGADVLTATELLGTGKSKMETIAILDVKIYTRPR